VKIISLIGSLLKIIQYWLSPEAKRDRLSCRLKKLEEKYEEIKKKRQLAIALGSDERFNYWDKRAIRLQREIHFTRLRLNQL